MAADCPFLHRGPKGQTKQRFIFAANEQCDDPDHRFLDAQHVPVEEELARLGLVPFEPRVSP